MQTITEKGLNNTLSYYKDFEGRLLLLMKSFDTTKELTALRNQLQGKIELLEGILEVGECEK